MLGNVNDSIVNSISPVMVFITLFLTTPFENASSSGMGIYRVITGI